MVKKNDLCQYLRKWMESSMENMHTDTLLWRFPLAIFGLTENNWRKWKSKSYSLCVTGCDLYSIACCQRLKCWGVVCTIVCIIRMTQSPNGQCIGLWVKRSGFETWPGQCFVFLGTTLSSHSASLSSREYKWLLANFQGSPMKCLGVTLRWTGIPYRRE